MMIRATALTKDYGTRRAIENLTFNARKGEILGFLGPNGAGKTTTMRILTGFMPPSSGSVEIGGYDVIENSLEVRRIVGYLPETVPLYSDMTVHEYLEYMGSLRKVPRLEQRINETIEKVELSDRASSYVGALSKGMRQRLGLAQALIHQPEVLILDEPTIGLDPGQVVNFRKLIREIGKDKTVLLSTHILPEAQQICDRVLIINNGHIVAEDTPEQLQARLTGSQRVLVQIRGDSKDVLPIVENIPGVIRAQVRNQDSIEFESLPGKDVRPEVARTLIQRGFDLLQMQNINLSLEEIFLKLTREEPAEITDSQA
ncbi:ABC transporter ATP-binding protein [Anaerolinea thermophila]|uniref:ABC transporter ATP-binding protein n=1 Tax=Anaerolinea thermophila (strain DSM 14523 / JCM 11388 / NBRC 100420 / UNI-1) TaxID=926569 RepID=E8N627_ANATU|nr:ATP-binding cassette domain-containing protein [Anaerolinea thermophila]BAJ63891.1 putative ABC transporter ATP-binding protein [Anaerolinea thermophila UNI-1]